MKQSAQLTGSLLARKGFALPSGAYSSLGKIDPPGFEPTALARSSDSSPEMLHPVVPQPPKGRHRGNCKTHASKCLDDAAHETGQVAMTLRLDPKRHKRLRLISVHSQRSARDILTSALDSYLDQIEAGMETASCECLRKNKP